MDIRIVKEALKHYAQSADCPAKDRNQVFEAIYEVSATIDRLEANEEPDKFKYSVRTIPLLTLSDLLNLATYDIYGKRARIHNGQCPFSYYTHDVYRNLNLVNLTAEQLKDGYDIIADLWCDNEEAGDHNPDGTLKR